MPAKTYLTAISAVFKITIFCVYSWSMLVFFWDLPSYLLRFSTREVIGLAAYHVTLALVESIVMTAVIATGVFILPLRSIRENLPVAGALTTLTLTVATLMFKNLAVMIEWIARAFHADPGSSQKTALFIFTAIISGLIVAALGVLKNKKANAAILNFIDNLSILTGLYIIASVPGIIIVISRNIP